MGGLNRRMSLEAGRKEGFSSSRKGLGRGPPMEGVAAMLWVSGILAVLVAMAAPSGGLAAESGMMELTERDCGQTRGLSLGSLCRLTLEEQGGTGFVWELAALDRERLEVLEVTTVRLGEKPQVGGPVAKTWLFRTVGLGTIRLALAYRRPWEQGGAPARRCEILLEVR